MLAQEVGHTRKVIERLDASNDLGSRPLSHMDSIMDNLSIVMGDGLLKHLTSMEHYLLVTAVHLHDIGLSPLYRERLSDETWPVDMTESDIIREHQLIGGAITRAFFLDFGIRDETTAFHVSRIIEGHRRANLLDRERFTLDGKVRRQNVNVALLASLLRIADALDTTLIGKGPVLLEHIEMKEDLPEDIWDGVATWEGMELVGEPTPQLNIHARCTDPRVHRTLKRWENWLGRELDVLTELLPRDRDLAGTVPTSAHIDIEPEGYTPFDFRFSLQESEIVNLLMGERLYKRAEESVRELIKNGVDACRLRAEMESRSGDDGYEPDISIELLDDRQTLVVEDNGTGMDEHIIERYFTKLGRSFYRSSDFTENYGMAPVGELGIGILSCFMVARKIEVETRTDVSDPLVVEIDDLTEYFFVSPGSREERGTRITLHLKPGVGERLDLIREVGHYTRHLEIPIHVKVPKRPRRTYKDDGFRLRTGDVLTPSIVKMYGLRFKTYRIDEDYAEGVLGTLMEDDPEMGSTPVKLSRYINQDTMEETVHLSNEGIFVGNLPVLPPIYHLYSDINLKNNPIELNLARNDLVRNERFSAFQDRLEKDLLDRMTDHLRKLVNNANTAGVEPYRAVDAFFEANLDINGVKDMQRRNEDPGLSDGFWTFIKRNFQFKMFTKSTIMYMRHSEVRSGRRRSMTLVDGLGRLTDDHIIQLIKGCDGFDRRGLFVISGHLTEFFAKQIFGEIDHRFLGSFLEMERSDEMEGMLPPEWELVRFRNYGTKRMIEFWDYSTATLNRDHPFIELIIKHKRRIEPKRFLVAGFFRMLEYTLKRGFETVKKNQREILDWMVSEGLITSAELRKYIIQKKDLPPHVFLGR